ncbi:MAG TPA: hypothetical protein VMO88_01500, partial [Acidimicrobiales bacterium]|nr:hypothetical protein [Acidimicrobiales bacterium]
KAAAPSKDGWWTVTNSGLGFAPPPPPQVPSGGLYIENGFTGPTAISALTFQVDPGSAVGSITLKIAGNPIMTSPPVACPITPAGQNYQPAQGGAWSAGPAYDCTKSQVTGTMSPDKTTVTFESAPLLANGTVAAVIKAGGSADRMAFEAPGPDTLAVTPSGSSGSIGAPTGAPAGQPAGAPVGIGGAASGGGAGSGSTLGPGSSGLGLVPAQNGSAASPSLAPSQASQVPAGTAAAGQSTTAGTGSGSRNAGAGPHKMTRIVASASTLRKDIAEAIGIAALIAALVAYSEGFGLLGGRIGGRLAPQRPASFSPDA